MPQSAQQIRFCTSRDGTGIAYATCGSGPPLVWVQHWIHHLKFDWDSPVWRPWLSWLARRYTLIRYDWRGCGLSDRDKISFSPEKLVDDLEAVVKAVGLERFALFGMSGAGSDAGYVIRHPDRVTHLALLGTQSRARWAGSPTPELVQEGEARLKVYELGWSNETPAYGEFFTALHIPDASIEYKAAYNDLLRQTTTAANAVGLLRAFYKLDLSEVLPKIRCPTLVLHARRFGDPVGGGPQVGRTYSRRALLAA
jgi:pimeloyl-ACP methyl ester carboxylesterase